MFEPVDMERIVEAVQAAAIAGGTKVLAEAAAQTTKDTVKSTLGAGKKVLGWLKGKLTGYHAQGLEHACEKPEQASRWETFGSQLRGLIEEDPAFAKEFAAFLKDVMPEAVGDVTVQTANVSNVEGKVNIAQIKGSGNEIKQQ